MLQPWRRAYRGSRSAWQCLWVLLGLLGAVGTVVIASWNQGASGGQQAQQASRPVRQGEVPYGRLHGRSSEGDGGSLPAERAHDHEPTAIPADAQASEQQAQAAIRRVDQRAAQQLAAENHVICLDCMPRRCRATDIARAIYSAYPANARLVDQGPEGLPGFAVSFADGRQQAEESPSNGERVTTVDYVVGIDEQQDRLVVHAPRQRAGQIVGLIQALDQHLDPGSVARFVPIVASAQRLAQLAQIVERLADPNASPVRLAQVPRAERTQEPRGSQQVAQQPPDATQPPAPPEPAQTPPPDQVPAPPAEAEQPAFPPLSLELRGPVTVRDVPGVGLVITGSQEDVEAVLSAIRALGIAAEGAAADIHLLMLLHVNSEALAELLNSVYLQLTEIRRPLAGEAAQTVRIIPVVKPNAILILAPDFEMRSVLELAEKLDQPVSPETELEIFRLKNAVADQVVTAIETFYADRAPLGTRVQAIADARTNSVIVQARGHDLEEVGRLIRNIDQDATESVNRMKIFSLQYASATELATVIDQAIQGVLRAPIPVTPTGQLQPAVGVGAEALEELRTAKSVILELIAAEGGEEMLVRSGILADIRVTADAARNSLIVTAPEQSMQLMAALIAQLDRPTPLVADIKVFTLANSDATVTADLLTTLFQPDQQAGQLAVQVAGPEGATSGLIPMRFTVDPRTNSIIASGSPDALRVVHAIILTLDQSDIRQRKNTVIKLQNTFAPDVSTALNEFLTAQRELAALDPNLVANVELLEREIIVVPEVTTNNLLISATPRYFDEIVRIVRQLDEKPPEVVIQALLVEVELNNTDEFGVELGGQDPVLFDRSVDGAPGFNFNNSALGNNVTGNTSSVGTQLLTDLGLARINPDLGFGSLVLSASSESLSVLIRALSAQRTVHILSRPTIRALDNQPGLIQVGQQVPIVTGANISNLGNVTPIIAQQQVGIILSVTPRVSSDGTIVMQTIATKSALAPTGVTVFTDSAGTELVSPAIDLTTAEAIISVPNGQTVVLGGMITKRDDALEQKIPWLGDLPILGYAFRYDSVVTRRTELLIFLTPRVIRNEADSELIKRVEAERLHFIEQDAQDIHGPLYSAPPACFEIPMESPTPQPGTQSVPMDDSGAPTDVLPMPDFSVRPIPQGTIRSEQRPVVDSPATESVGGQLVDQPPQTSRLPAIDRRGNAVSAAAGRPPSVPAGVPQAVDQKR